MLKLSKEIPIESLVARQLSAWEHAHKHRSRHPGPEELLPCLTISRQAGSRGEQVARAIAARLGWQVFDREIIEYIAHNANVRKGLVEMFDEKTQSALNNWILTLLDHHALSTGRFIKHLVTTILSIAQHGKAVILGRGANFVIPDARALKIRLIEPLAQRIQYVQEAEKLSPADAERWIAEQEEERAKFIKFAFRKDASDPVHYDLVLNLANRQVEQAADIVVAALQTKFPQALSEVDA